MRRSIESMRLARDAINASRNFAATPLGRALLASMRGEPLPADVKLPISPLPSGETMAEQRLIALFPEEVEASLKRSARQIDVPSKAQLAYAEEILREADPG